MSLAWIFDDRIQPEWATAMEARLTQRMEYIMAEVSVAQEDLDALDQALDQVATSLADKIASLNLPAGDLQPLLDDVETLRGLAAPAPTGSG